MPVIATVSSNGIGLAWEKFARKGDEKIRSQ